MIAQGTSPGLLVTLPSRPRRGGRVLSPIRGLEKISGLFPRLTRWAKVSAPLRGWKQSLLNTL